MKAKIKLCKRLRKLPNPQPFSPYDARSRNCAAIIATHPQAELIISSLKEGLSATAIAQYLAANNLIEQSERTFADYIQCFRRVHPELFEDGSAITLDDIVGANKPPVDIEKELNRLYRIQRTRIALGVNGELVSKRLQKDLYRELAVARDCLEIMAKIEGKLSSSGKQPDDDLSQYSPNVQQALHGIREDEEARAKIRALTEEYARRYGLKERKKYPSETAQ